MFRIISILFNRVKRRPPQPRPILPNLTSWQRSQLELLSLFAAPQPRPRPISWAASVAQLQAVTA